MTRRAEVLAPDTLANFARATQDEPLPYKDTT